MAANEERIPLREAVRLYKRAFLMLSGYCPGFFPFTALKEVVSSIIPYVTVFFSARIIDELAGLRRPDMLWHWVLLTIMTDAALLKRGGGYAELFEVQSRYYREGRDF